MDICENLETALYINIESVDTNPSQNYLCALIMKNSAHNYNLLTAPFEHQVGWQAFSKYLKSQYTVNS